MLQGAQREASDGTMVDAVTDRLAATSLTSQGATPRHGGQTATELVAALQRASESGPKSKRLIRSTVHRVPKDGAKERSAAVAVGSSSDAVTSSGYVADGDAYELTSWKTAEFAYRKWAGLSSELPTLARGLFTEQVGKQEHRIVVRGYDKFFNVGELPWTKRPAITRYSTPPYHLTFKENGCIIFISALSPNQLVVTSKHSLGAREDVEMSHAVKGEEWLAKHLAQKGKSKADLAAELWTRNETAVCELCDDSFEEHVIAYKPENSGLHLHGLNSNQPQFSTRHMAEVDTFARQWGFIPTRYLEINTMEEVDRLTEEISRTGSWRGEPIEGFVVRTHMPTENRGRDTTSADEPPIARPPYAPGQEWFYKIKFDEPYLMYRDWRELTRRLLKEKKEWESKARFPEVTDGDATTAAEAADQEPTPLEAAVVQESDTAPKSKKQKKKANKKANQERRHAEALAAQAAAKSKGRPPRPELRFKRPKTLLYVEWAYNLLHGSDDGSVQPQPHMFEKFNEGKGIIALRDAYLAYLRTPAGSRRLRELGGLSDQDEDDGAAGTNRPKFDKTIIVPIGVPGCGKTSLFVALSAIFGWAHTQSDDVQTKKTGPAFLANIEKELGKNDVVIADRNNHLFKHRNEIVGVVEKVKKGGETSRQSVKSGKGGKGDAPTAKPGTARPPRIQLVAVTWAFDSYALNDVHKICSARIVKRGDNHQSLRADPGASSASTAANKRAKLPHEHILWEFLENLQPFGSSLGGEGDEGEADALFNETVKLNFNDDQEAALRRAISALAPLLDLTQPSEAQIQHGLETARNYRVAFRKEMDMRGRVGGSLSKPRYFGLSVDADIEEIVTSLIRSSEDAALRAEAQGMFEKLKADGRVIQNPHITLVHSSSVQKEGAGAKAEINGDGKGAKARWDRYAALCKQHDSYQRQPPGGATREAQGKHEEEDAHHPLAFSFGISSLVWNDRIMAFGVADVLPSPQGPLAEDFATLQGVSTSDGEHGVRAGWSPHITIATVREEVRPYEAHEAVRLAEMRVNGRAGGAEASSTLNIIRSGDKTVRLGGRLQGMW